jgi:hypothetical protein
MNDKPSFKQPVTVWWMIWVALLSGIFVVYFVVEVPANATPVTSSPEGSSMWMIGFAPFVISIAIRWLVIPRVQSARIAFALFVAGVAVAEVSSLLGAVVYPAHKLELFALSVLGIVQFAPYFASRFIGQESE